MDNPPSIGAIQSVNTAVWRHIVGVWGWKFFAPAALLAGLGVVVLIQTSSPAGLVAALFWIFGGYGLVRSKIERKFFDDLARELCLRYVGRMTPGDTRGNLFARGRSRALNHTLQGVFEGRPTRFFQYHFTTGSGKNKHHHYFAVCEVTFGGLVPDMTVDPRSLLKDLNLEWPHQRRISIRPDFDEAFEVHVNEHLKIEAFEVFTPEIIAELLRPERRGYSFEFIGNALYVMKKGQTLDRASFLALVDIARYLVTTLGPRLVRLSDDVAAMQEATALAR